MIIKTWSRIYCPLNPFISLLTRMRCLQALNLIQKGKGVSPGNEESFCFFLKTPLEDDGGQEVFMRGMRIGSSAFLKFNKKPVIGQVGKTNS